MSLRDSKGPAREPVVDVEEGHLPVMVEEVMAALSPAPGSFHIDATVGGGGHALRVLEAAMPHGRLLGIDADASAIARTSRRLERFGEAVVLRQAAFERLREVATEAGFSQVDGILFDLGLSSHQLADPSRSFSFRSDGPLDMRFDRADGKPASALVAEMDERDLMILLRRFGEEPHARRISQAIVTQRQAQPIDTGVRLAEVVAGSLPAQRRGRLRSHPATRVFQALRIAVNRELEQLPVALDAAVDLLRPGGRLAVLAYHSLEDRIVKRFVVTERRGCVCPPESPICMCGRAPRLAPLGRQPLRPSDAEVAANPRSRSARLRVAARLAA